MKSGPIVRMPFVIMDLANEFSSYITYFSISSNNDLERIPDSIGELTNVEVLDLRDNNIQSSKFSR